MALLDPKTSGLAFGLSGRIKGGLMGAASIGYALLGTMQLGNYLLEKYTFLRPGIYQMRLTKRGKVPVRMRFYEPTNPESTPQQANRTKFADAVAAWMALTSEQKASYTKRAKKRGMFGWGLFIREYYQAN